MKRNGIGPESGVVALGDVASNVSDSVDPTSLAGVCYVGLEHIDSGNPILNRFGDSSEVKSAKNRFLPGDVLYGKLRPYLDKAVLADREGICSTDILVIRTRESILPEFLVLVLHQDRLIEYAKQHTQGVNHPRTKWSALRKFAFKLPCITRQEEIVNALNAIQEAASARRAELELERERKAALLQHIISTGIRASGKTQETQFGPVPGHWRIKSLDACATVQTGIAKGRKFKPDEVPVEVPYLRVANVQDGYLDLSEIKTIEVRENDLDRYALLPGDVLLTEGGDLDKLGRGYIWEGQIDPCIHQNHVFAVRPDPGKLLPEFLALQAHSPYGRAYFLSVAHKTTNLACINTAKLKRYPALLPSIEEQREVCSIFDPLNQKMRYLVEEIHLVEELFRSVLEELITRPMSDGTQSRSLPLPSRSGAIS